VTDQTKCPHCGAGKSPEYRQLRFDCGTIMCDNEVARSSQCELKTLRAKVAAQQELLKGILKCHTSIGTQTVTAVIPIDMWEQIELDAYS